jgi:hypothetical protein
MSREAGRAPHAPLPKRPVENNPGASPPGLFVPAARGNSLNGTRLAHNLKTVPFPQLGLRIGRGRDMSPSPRRPL